VSREAWHGHGGSHACHTQPCSSTQCGCMGRVTHTRVPCVTRVTGGAQRGRGRHTRVTRSPVSQPTRVPHASRPAVPTTSPPRVPQPPPPAPRHAKHTHVRGLPSGSDQSRSHMGPSWGTSCLRSMVRIWSSVWMDGERPPCTQKICGATRTRVALACAGTRSASPRPSPRSCPRRGRGRGEGHRRRGPPPAHLPRCPRVLSVSFACPSMLVACA